MTIDMAGVATEDRPVLRTSDVHRQRLLVRSSTFDGGSADHLGGSAPRLQRSSSHAPLRRRPQLQLPSFEKLGISAMKSKLSEFDHRDAQLQARPLSASIASHRSVYQSDSPDSPSAFPFLGSAPLLTPPDDQSSMKWNRAISQPPEHGNPSRISAAGANISSASGITVAATKDQSSRTGEQPAQPLVEDAALKQPAVDKGVSETSQEQAGNFLTLGIEANVSSLSIADAQMNGVTVISQTLPHPIHDSNPHSAFTPMVQAIQSKFDGSWNGRPPYIRITHAVPPQFTLRNLPSSPPSTPSRQMEDDYFSLNVFSNAAPVRTYHLYDGSVDRSAPPSPAPIVPPSTVQTALIERYIPPSTSEEHDSFFSTHGPSVLVDRLFELSAHGGSLMLVYPTKVGGETFRSDHVGPLLDSFLRTMVVVNDMSSDLASALGRMPAIKNMLGFQEMKEKITSLCRHLSRPRSTASANPEYSVAYSGVGEVPLDRATWSEWFLQQETPRMKAALKSYWQRGQKLPPSKDTVIPATLLRDITNCVEGGKYEMGEPTRGIEVGVFVIRRTR